MADLSRLGATTCGLWTRREALAVLPPGWVAGLLRDGTWQRPLPGIYADGGHVLNAVQWGLAVVLASDSGKAAEPRRRAVACGRTAARVWGLPLIDDEDPATGTLDRYHHDVAVDGHRRDRGSGCRDVLFRHQLQLAGQDVVRHPSGLWLTTPERTLVDLARLVGRDALVCAVDHALHHHLVRREELLLAVVALRGRRGAPRFAEAVALADERAESPAETLARLIFAPHLPGLRPQVELRAGNGRLVARFDLADVLLRFALEVDGKRGHSGALMVAKDRRRDATTSGLGWVTERVTWYELRRQQSAVVRRVVSAAAARRAGPPPPGSEITR